MFTRIFVYGEHKGNEDYLKDEYKYFGFTFALDNNKTVQQKHKRYNKIREHKRYKCKQ